MRAVEGSGDEKAGTIATMATAAAATVAAEVGTAWTGARAGTGARAAEQGYDHGTYRGIGEFACSQPEDA